MDEALEILDQIREQVGTCCAVTMYPEDVEELIDKLKELLIKLNSDNNRLNNYKKKYSELRNLIMNGFNKVNEERLNIFCLDKNGN